MEIVIDNKKYELIKNYRDAFNQDDLEGKITEYFDNFDFILGDYAYGKVRLKGFNDKDSEFFKPINDIASVDDYIINNCAYDCKYFILKRVRSVEK